MHEKINVLAVDDEELNLDIMQEYFDEANYDCTVAHDGVEALNALKKTDHVDVIVLDRMMPNMNGMEFLQKVKESKEYRDIPVIMQTAATASHQVAEGINSGVFYYLSKPYTKEVFLSLIKAANDDTRRKTELRKQMQEYGKAMSMIMRGEFKFRTVEEAKALAVLVCSCFPDAETKVLGMTELMINSVEHGNLGITYQEKGELKKTENWEKEIDKRLALPENMTKFCDLSMERSETGDEFIVRVKDQGNGFDWRKFIEFDANRLMDPNGRGVMLSQNTGFDSVEYQGNGNEFMCKVKIEQK
jgi:CheY-like chemotaxis protein